MLSVSPIKELQMIELLKSYFYHSNIRDYLFFVISINLPDYLLSDLTSFIQQHHLRSDDYLFQSVKTKQPLTRQQVYRIINEAVMTLQLDAYIGAHSLKKTFAYHAYQHHMDIHTLQHLLGHQSKSETYKFIQTEPPVNKELHLNL